MSYKIVRTIENGQFCTWTVPETWESEGIVRCPTFNFKKFQRDPLSLPQESWQFTDCVLVRSNLLSIQAAEAEIRLMNDVADKGETHEPTKIAPGLEAFAEFLVAGGSKSRSAQPQQTMSIAAASPEIHLEFSPAQYSEVSSKLDSLMADVSGIAKKQAETCENQKMMMNKLSLICSRLDEVIKRTSGSLGKPKERSGRIKPIADRKSLDELEDSLKNDQTAEEIRKTFSIVCGEGKGRAINNAYALIDAMFDRKFLLECSWAGGSRSDKSKVCFKGYRNVVNFFFQIVYSSDRHFTMMECETFLKCVLRNAKKRYESKKMRASRSKNRQKRTKRTENKTNDDEILELEDVCVLIPTKENPEQDAVKLEIEPESEEENSDYLL